jgi:mRNA-degrading endonuclease RelE of RelBE toxin-antitoxin system
MSYNVFTIAPFDRQLKRLFKKYPSLKQDFNDFLDDLEKNPIQGNDLGRNCFKVRFKISSKNKGKSGGARVITNVLVTKETIYLLTIYDKSDQETLSNKELDELLKYVPDDL